LTGALLASAAPGLCAAAPAGATPSSSYGVHRVCGAPAPGDAACQALKVVAASPTPAITLGTPGAGEPAPGSRSSGGNTPAVEVKKPLRGYLTPQDLHAAYSLPTETSSSSSQTIAVVDAFDDPTIEADLGVYDEQFGLPACSSANGCFHKLNQEGQPGPLPRTNGDWASEISIDVEMAHAICQSCHVLLVEANTASLANLGAAVDTAVGAGATEISNSYDAAERHAYLAFAGSYDHPGIVITASSGDCGYLNQDCPGEPSKADFPSDSPDVIAVGGTTLTHRAGTWTSRVWSESGSACSELFDAPPWQSAAAGFAATGCGDGRAIADVAADGNPDTGVDVFDSTPEGHEPTGWTGFGGTSVSSPIIAAEFALAGGAQGVSYPAATLYSHLGESEDLYDVVHGSNGSCDHATICRAVVGYDGPSGVGSPIGLGAFAAP
jgi:subtilase family serine protease